MHGVLAADAVGTRAKKRLAREWASCQGGRCRALVRHTIRLSSRSPNSRDEQVQALKDLVTSLLRDGGEVDTADEVEADGAAQALCASVSCREKRRV